MFYDKNNLPDDPKTLKQVCIDMFIENERLSDMLRLNRHHRFGPSSEAIAVLNALFPDEEDTKQKPEATEEGTRPEVTVKEHKKKVGRKPIPKNIPRHDVHQDVEDKCCLGCGTEDELKKVSEDVSEKLHIEPAKVSVMRYIRPVYSCKKCESMQQAPLPPHPIPKCSVTPETIAHIAVSKYMDSLPLYRQEQMYLRSGVEVARENMARWMVQISQQLLPLKEMLHKKLLATDMVSMDETTVQVLKEKGRTPTSKSYMLVQARGDPGDGESIVLFHYNPSRAKYVIKDLMQGFSGVFMTDGLGVYDSLCLGDSSITHVGCWQHAKRKFKDAERGLKPSQRKHCLASEAITMINKLFKIEKTAKEFGEAQRLALRQEKSKPVVEELEAWLDKYIGAVPKTSLTGNALHYLSNQWDKLVRFLDDGRAPLHNNFTENMIRPFTVGRRNWLFSDTPEGAEASATIYSLLVTAKVNGLNPYDYFCNVLKSIPVARTEEELESLLPFSSVH